MMFTPAPRKVLPLHLITSILTTSSLEKEVVVIVALPLSPVTTVYFPLLADSVVVIVKLPERIVVPFFFTFTSKFPPTGRVVRDMRSFVAVKAL